MGIQEGQALILIAASLGFLHALFGPDHYLPFIAMSKAGRWSAFKTFWITALSGVGHLLSSFLLGLIGIYFGTAVSRLEMFESLRGNLAGWALIAFGLVYFVWGLRRALKNKVSSTPGHLDAASPAGAEPGVVNLTPWIMMAIFVLGPCEPLIPVMMYPAAKSSFSGMLMISGVFAGATLATMLTVVMVSCFGVSRLPLGRMERYSHALAGLTVLFCGLGMQFLGL